MPTVMYSGRALLALTLTAATLTLGGCVTTTASGGTSVFCRSAEPIRWSTKDTDETIRQAKAHNAVGRKLCGWK